MNAVVTDSRHDRVELNHISHESSQSGQGGGRSTITRESHQKHGGGGTGLRDELIESDDSSSKVQAAIRSESPLLKVDLILGSNETSNSSVMKANISRTLE